MTVTYQSSATGNTGGVAATSVAVTMPSGVVAGWVLLAGVTVAGGSGVTITPPSGWTLVGSHSQGTNVQTIVYWRLATGTEAASYTFSFSTSAMSSWVTLLYSGTYPYQPVRSATADSGGTATTGVALASAPRSYLGKGIAFTGGVNTTGTNTNSSSPTGSYTKRADTCTTASTYTSLGAYESPAATSTTTASWLGNAGGSTDTTTQSVNYSNVSVFLDDDHSSYQVMQMDELGSNGNAAYTHFGNQLILVYAAGFGGTSPTVSSVSGGGPATWTFIARANTAAGGGNAELWAGVTTTTAVNGSNITVTWGGSPATTFNYCASFQGTATHGAGAGAIGAVNAVASSSAAPSGIVTTTRANSWVWGFGVYGTAAVGITTGTNQALVRSGGDGSLGQDWLQYCTGLAGPSGTIVTVNDTTPSTDSVNLLIYEMLAPPFDTGTFADTGHRITLAATDSASFTPAVAVAVSAHDTASFTGHAGQVAAKVADTAAFTGHPKNLAGAVHDSLNLLDGDSFEVTDMLTCTDTAEVTVSYHSAVIASATYRGLAGSITTSGV